MMMDNMQPPMQDMMGNNDPMGMGGPPPMNGGMDPMGGGPNMGPPMMDDPMMGPPPMMDQMQPNDGFFENSEYLRSNQKKQIGHELVSRQSSSASMDLDTVSVKKIEDREDEYGKVKQALLSEFDLSPESFPHLSPPSFLNSPAINVISPTTTCEVDKLPSSGSFNVNQRQRSKDTLESIFGGSAAEPMSACKVEQSTESRSSFSSVDYHCSQSSLLDAEQHVFNPLHHQVEEHQSRIRVEEPFPVCLSPELDLQRTLTPLIDVYTIHEVPEEEEGSPVTGDGVSSRYRNKGKSIRKRN